MAMQYFILCDYFAYCWMISDEIPFGRSPVLKQDRDLIFHNTMNKLGFDFRHLRGDILGGITAGIVALPLALAFGLQSGMGAAAGLYGAIFIGFFAALFGGTNTQISGPTAPMTAVSMVVIAGIVAANEGDLGRAIPAILFVFILSGLFQIVFGVFKVGEYIRYIPYPVVSGFMTGIGVIILATQILPMVGYYPREDTEFVSKFVPLAEEVILENILKDEAAEEILVLEDFEETVKRAGEVSQEDIDKEATTLAANNSSGVINSLKLVPRALKNISYIDVILSVLTLLIIYNFGRITKAVPAALVALVALTAGSFFILGEEGYRTIGTIPTGFPKLNFDIISNFSFSQVSPYIFTALTLAILGAIDSLLTAIVADNKTKTRHNPNKELIGQGIGNAIAGFFGGIPGAGATIRTVINIDAGGVTRLSGMIAGILLLLVLLVFGPLASMIPAAVLAGILVSVGIGVMDYKGLKAFKTMPRSEVVVMVLVLTLTVFVGLIEAVIVGLVLACILFMKKIADVVEDRTNFAPLKQFSREISWEDEGDTLERLGDQVYIKHLDGPLFFGFASRFQEMSKALPEIKVVIIRMDKVPYVDQSGLYAMEDAVFDLRAEEKRVVFTGLSGQPKDMFEKFKLIPDRVSDEYCFEDFESCQAWLEGYLIELDKSDSANVA